MVTLTNSITKDVQDYYEKIMTTRSDLGTGPCCSGSSVVVPSYLKPLLKKIHPEVQEQFCGCGLPIPYDLQNKTILNLACGTGRDTYLLSQLVGNSGQVIGIETSEDKLSIARNHLDYHMKAFGYNKPNVTFHQGYIEDLKAVGISDNSVDVVIFNCAINISPQKEKIFREIFRVLKPGGELYFSDIFADRRIPKHLSNDPTLLAECLGGAMYIDDFRRMLINIGCLTYRVTDNYKIDIKGTEQQRKAGMINFQSITIRTFKCDFEDRCEGYGHVAYYKGTIALSPHSFVLDDHHTFHTGVPHSVCGNTTKMLLETRYKEHFRIDGDYTTHYGSFNC